MSDWELSRLYHTVVNCRDIEESVAFYKLLGFQVVHDRRDHVWPEYLAAIFGMERAQGKAVLVGLPADPGGPILDLIEWVEPEVTFTDPADFPKTVARTICFATRGVHAAYEALSAKGVRFTCPPAGQAEAGIIAVAFCYDPSGNKVELLEFGPDYAHAKLDAAHTAGSPPQR